MESDDRSEQPDGRAEPRPDPANDDERTVVWQAGFVTRLFGLSLATGLLPDATRAPPRAVQPTVQPESLAILDPVELAVILDRPTTEVGRGRVALGEVDERLCGLAVALELFRVADGAEIGSGALVSLGLVRRDRTANGDDGVTCAGLWQLARMTLAQHQVPQSQLAGLGDDAFLAVHGGMTAQVAWVAGACLTTASVTCLAGELCWAIEAARSIATYLDRRPGR